MRTSWSAASVTARATPRSARRTATSFICMRATLSSCSWESGSNTTISSNRFNSSGRKCLFTWNGHSHIQRLSVKFCPVIWLQHPSDSIQEEYRHCREWDARRNSAAVKFWTYHYPTFWDIHGSYTDYFAMINYQMEEITSCMTFSFARSMLCSPINPASKCSAPRLEVRIITVLVKSTVRPCPSVSRPSSSICKSVLKTEGCAFSTSSKSTTLYGRLLTASVSWPPSSCPTYLSCPTQTIALRLGYTHATGQRHFQLSWHLM